MSNIQASSLMVVFGIASVLSGCRDAPLTESSLTLNSESTGPFDALLLKAANEYRAYRLANASADFAPPNCSYIPAMFEQRSRFSRSRDDATHGQKLYHLYVKDFDAYRSAFRESHFPCGQTLVKDSFAVVSVGPVGSVPIDRTTNPNDGNGSQISPFAIRDGQIYRTGERIGLFIMLKLDPTTPDTDNGWVYGTVSPDGKTVTSAGRVDSCMKCHLKAPHDRLFGPHVYTRH